MNDGRAAGGFTHLGSCFYPDFTLFLPLNFGLSSAVLKKREPTVLGLAHFLNQMISNDYDFARNVYDIPEKQEMYLSDLGS